MLFTVADQAPVPSAMAWPIKHEPCPEGAGTAGAHSDAAGSLLAMKTSTVAPATALAAAPETVKLVPPLKIMLEMMGLAGTPAVALMLMPQLSLVDIWLRLIRLVVAVTDTPSPTF